LHSSVNNHDTSTNILTVKEIIAVIVIFSFVLYLIFPKDNIDSLLKENSKNTNLSINYLESMLLYYPNNIKLKMILVKNYDYAGETNKALKLNQEIINEVSDKKLLVKLYKTEYLLEKDNYFKNKKHYLLTLLKKRLLDYYAYTEGDRDYLFLFAESTNIDYVYLKYQSLIGLMKQQPELIDYEFEKQAYYLALTLNYKEKAYRRLISLLNYNEIEENLQNHALNSLITHKEYNRATEIAHKLFLNSYNRDESTKFFYLALYALGQDPSKKEGSIRKLIADYMESKELDTLDINTILTTLLQQGRVKEASSHALSLFHKDSTIFDEKSIELAIKALTYNSKLSEARELVAYAEEKFHKQKYLDQQIQLSIWLSDIKAVNQLQQIGYQKYTDIKYEKYLLEKANMDDSYAILGTIYKDKVEQGKYSFVKNLSVYYNYTGKLHEAENYFNSLLKKVKNREVHAAAVNFTLNNSHFEKAFELYREYQSNYKLNAILQERVIKRLIAAKHFTQAYKLTKILNNKKELKEKRLLTDLSWIEKDYNYLYKQLWSFEKNSKLNSSGYEHLILFEKALNRGEKLQYLYKKAWTKTKNSYYLIAKMYKEIASKSFSKFKKTIEDLTPYEKRILSKNIDYQIMLSSYYAQKSDINLALKAFDDAFKISPLKVSTHQSYIWFLIDNQKEHKKLNEKIKAEVKLLKANPLLQNSVGIASIVSAIYGEQNALASRWSRRFIKRFPKNREYKKLYQEVLSAQKTELYKIYDKMQNNQYLNGQISIERRHLSANQDVEESELSYQWKIYKKIQSKLQLKLYSYKTKNLKNRGETAFELALKNSKEKFLWELSLGLHHAQKNTLMSRANLGYSFYPIQLNVEVKYKNKTKLTPILEKEALENALSIHLQSAISTRISLGFAYKKSLYQKVDGTKLGSATQLQLNTNYILHSGYPDITFNGYISNNYFSNKISKDFSELGVAMSIGKSRKITINREWRPFGTLGLAINNQHNIGSSISLGISKSLKGHDSLDFLINYNHGIGVVSEPSYGVNVKYRF